MDFKADPGLRVGHVHLKVSDLDRAVKWYCDVLGFEVMQRYDNSAAFLSAGGYHHHLGLNVWRSRGGPRPERNATGLFHSAFLYPTRAALGRAVARVLEKGVTLDGASDHGVSQAVYFDDPDGNGIELYWDRAPEDWPKNKDGGLAMTTERLDIDDLLRAALDGAQDGA